MALATRGANRTSIRVRTRPVLPGGPARRRDGPADHTAVRRRTPLRLLSFGAFRRERSGEVLVLSPCEELTVAGPTDEPAVLDDKLAARKHGLDLSLHGHSLVRRVVGTHVMACGRDRLGRRAVVDDEVGVRPGRDYPLFRIEPEHARRSRRRDLDPALERDLAADNALVYEVHSVLDAREAVRDLREIAHPELFLLLEAERAVVGRND